MKFEVPINEKGVKNPAKGDSLRNIGAGPFLHTAYDGIHMLAI